ncbi:hypothetical protein L7F22_064432 [Adiantum nelumboides]|nr:hypothetical protein [Adiantum nelumboides]
MDQAACDCAAALLLLRSLAASLASSTAPYWTSAPLTSYSSSRSMLTACLASLSASCCCPRLCLYRRTAEGPSHHSDPPPLWSTSTSSEMRWLAGSLSSLQSLTFVDLCRNQLSAASRLPFFAAPLSSLLLQRNLLTGTVSPQELVTITTVNVSFNQLRAGAISPIFAFVQYLYLNNHHFTRAVPAEFIEQLLSSSAQFLDKFSHVVIRKRRGHG